MVVESGRDPVTGLDLDGNDILIRWSGPVPTLAEVEAGRVSAKEVTPFLLDRIYELTGGRSLSANIELVLNNARLAARIAAAAAKLN